MRARTLTVGVAVLFAIAFDSAVRNGAGPALAQGAGSPTTEST